jgi:hypothetical protein
MTHPEPSDNPHAGAFPGLSVDDSGNVFTGYDADGNPVTLHVTPTANHGAAPGDDLGGEQPSASQTGPDGTEPSTSSPTVDRSEKSGETPSPRPAPDAVSPSASAPTTPSTAGLTAGDGTAPQTAPTRQSGPAADQN